MYQCKKLKTCKYVSKYSTICNGIKHKNCEFYINNNYIL